jgi:glycosyltransferase involved in cell wall biosynthesis
MLGDIHVIRYRYFIFRRNSLLNVSGIAQTLSQNKFNFIFVPFFLISQLFAIKKNIKKFQIDTIHAHWLIPQGFAACLYKKIFNKKVKIICTSHGSDLNMNFGCIGKKLLKFTLKNIDSLTVVSEELKEKAVSIGYKNNIEVIPMGIDTAKFKHVETNEIRKRYNLSGKILLFVGLFNEVKGIEYLIRALPFVIKKQPAITLILVGDGMLNVKLKKIAEELGVTNNVIYTGLIPNNEMPLYFSTADLVISPSLSEGCPVVMMEAMACSSLIICSDIDAFQKHIKNDENGFIVQVKNSKAIAEKIIELLENPNELNNVRVNARKYALENFDWNIVTKKYDSILN